MNLHQTPGRWPLIALLLSLTTACGVAQLTPGRFAPGEDIGPPWEGATLEVGTGQQLTLTLLGAEPVTTTLEELPQDQWMELGNTPLGKAPVLTYRLGEDPLMLEGITLAAPRLGIGHEFVVLAGTDEEGGQAVEVYFDRLE